MIGHTNLEDQLDVDFHHARRKAVLSRLTARLQGECGRLRSFEEVRRALRASGGSLPRRRVVEVSKVVGSVGRFRDFSRDFLPARPVSVDKWKRVDRAFHRGVDLPPVELYRIGEDYYVQDGNHRVSVARYQGIEMIEAVVRELSPHPPEDVGPVDRGPCDPLRSSKERRRPGSYSRSRAARFLARHGLKRFKERD
ncbi:MAG: hypothetical protein H0V53_10035 [Rubrobacter sp.]|jgi:hypothetical protein|nr:hypothetical protein [Rubrobacter sp.]